MAERARRGASTDAAAGALPTFLIIGAMRAGTTSLAAYLSAHPDVFIARQKEVHFFDREFDRGVDWYREQFAEVRDEKAIGEATPAYLSNAEAPARIAALLPDARLIATLRDPVDRAYSHYCFMRGFGQETRSFAEAIEQDDGTAPGLVGNYLSVGRYLPQLERVCSFFPRTSLHVFLFEDLRADAAGTFADVCRFIGVDDAVRPPILGEALNPPHRLRSKRLMLEMQRWHAWRRLPFKLGERIDRWNRAPVRYPPLDRGLRRALVDRTAEDRAALARWLGRDLSVWER